jgi:hypothetical protein
MKTIFALLAFCLSGASVYASHLLGGYITAKQQSGRIYEITVVTLSDPGSPANEFTSIITVNFGDTKSEEIARTSVSHDDVNVNRNTYITTHEYSTDGNFIISYTDPNLIPNIININGGNSDMLPFYIESMVKVDGSTSKNQTAIPLAYEKVTTVTNQASHYNPTFAGAGDEEISYELVTPTNLPNYVLPSSTFINPYSGMLSFTPMSPGYYLFFIKSKSFKNGVLIASVTAAQLVNVKDAVFALPVVEIADVDLYAAQGWYRRSLEVNEVMSQPFTFSSVNSNIIGAVFSELFTYDATDSIIHATGSSTTIIVDWTALPIYVRETPYFATYRLRSADNFIYDYNIAFYHGAPLNTGIFNVTSSTTQEVFIYPNPADNEFTLVFPEQLTAQILVYDALGKIVLSDKINGKAYHAETALWKSGIYSYSLQMQNGDYIKGKIIVR